MPPPWGIIPPTTQVVALTSLFTIEQLNNSSTLGCQATFHFLKIIFTFYICKDRVCYESLSLH